MVAATAWVASSPEPPSGREVTPSAPSAAVAPRGRAAGVLAPLEGKVAGQRPIRGDAERDRVPAGRPLSITIPALRVDAPVVPVDTAGSVLVPPSDPQTIGWWAAGARPGDQTGAALLTGHTVHTGGGAFDDLDRVPVGSTVRISTRGGRLAYGVRRVENYPKQSRAAHAAALFSQERRGRLVLVTCEDWNGEAYLSNAVVVADPAW